MVLIWDNKIWLLLTSSLPLSDSYTLNECLSIKLTKAGEYGLQTTITKLWQAILTTRFNLEIIELLTFQKFCGFLFCVVMENFALSV